MRIQEYRKIMGITQKQLAKKLDVDQAAVSNWERGVNKPQRKYQKKLAKIFGCTMEELNAVGTELEGAGEEDK